MPFIMLPTVDCVNESTKCPLPTTGYSPTTKERRTPNSIFTRFSMKPDLLGKDLALGRQCGQQQQQPRQTEGEGDEDGVCDLNRYSSRQAPPSSLNVDDQERLQISMAAEPSESWAPLLLLSSSNETPMAAAETNGSLTTSTAADVVFLGRTQIAFITLMRQLSHVARHAGTVFQGVSTDIDRIFEQSQRLKSRLEVLQVHADSLLGKKAAKSSSSAGLVRYTDVKKHFRSVTEFGIEDKGDRCRLFAPFTRSAGIVALYEAADKDPSKKRIRFPNSPAVEHCATQTDDIRTSGATQLLIRRGATLSLVPTVNDKESSKRVLHPSSTSNLLGQASASAVDRRLHRHSQEHRESSPEGEFANEIDVSATESACAGEVTTSSRSSGQKCTSKGDEATNSAAIRSTQFRIGTGANSSDVTASVIAIDTSGAALRRVAKLRKSGQYGEIVKRSELEQKAPVQKETGEELAKQRRGKLGRQSQSSRRNTIVGYEIDSVSCDNAGSMTNCDHLGRLDYADDSSKLRRGDFPVHVIGTTGDSIANEVVYEFAPFYRRKSKRLLATGNFFSSLRRLKKDKRVMSPPVAVSTPIKGDAAKDDPVDYSSPDYSTKNEMSSSVHSDSAAMSPGARGPSEESMITRESQKSGASSAIKGLKQLFQRSASLRRPKKEKAPSLNATMPSFCYSPPPIPLRLCLPPGGEAAMKSMNEDDPENRSTSSSLGFQRNYTWRPKTSLPISTTSQVIHLAAQLRDRPPAATDATVGKESDQRFSKLSSSSSRDSAYSSCGKKLRPPSVVSLASLDFTEGKVNGWYRQGYQLEYPDECVREDKQRHELATEKAIVHASTTAKTPNIDKAKPKVGSQPLASRDTSNSSPYSDVSSFVDSNFSCDREGYFTTMHRDCGLSKRIHGRSGGLSVEERKVLIVAPSIQDAVGGSSSSLSTVTEPLTTNAGNAQGQTTAPAPAGNRNRCIETKQRPADLSLPATIPVTYQATSPPPTSAASEAEIKFDLWLMSKFHAEQRMQQFRRQQQRSVEATVNCASPRLENDRGGNFFSRSFGRFSLPRSRKENHKMKNDYVVEYLRSLGYGENELIQKQQQPVRSSVNADHSCTMPRKTVRFCE